MSESIVTKDQFEGLKGKEIRFSILHPEGDPPDAHPLNLAAVDDLPRRDEGRPGALEREPFALIFKGPKDLILPQSLYRLEGTNGDDWPVEELFIVPVGTDDEGHVLYEAIFN